jgi:hypothetical protein
MAPLTHPIPAEDSYEHDLYAWSKTQADLLRRRAANEIDWTNLADELEDMGKSTRRELGSRLEVLLAHLLKWRYQPELQCGSWRGSIREQRYRIKDILDDSPSLQSWAEQHLDKAYDRARVKALEETRVLHMPGMPWSIEQVLDDGFLP